MGEFQFINRVKKLVGTTEQVIEGIGDDCAVLDFNGQTLLVSTDLFIEDIHFRRSAASFEDIGWKAAAGCLSDIAAMGGAPRFMLLSLAAPADADTVDLEDLYAGFLGMCGDAGAVLVGGDTTRSERGITLDAIVIGEAIEGRYLTRGGAKPGDLLAVTGFPGMSAAGLYAQENGHDAPALVKAHHRPVPRIAEGRWLAKHAEVRAMLDLSDGLIQDAGHLAERASLGLEIDRAKLPIGQELEDYCAAHGLDPSEFAMAGGEAYELLFAIDPEAAPAFANDFAEQFDLGLSVVGEFTDRYTEVQIDGKIPESQGFDHFEA
ncbi:MAG TPA: thiamine-phosphate kinase [Gammaproteobacteria bacterium]|nr:thiamine-phosphate kinase [Gammaproteobacteria bacterium]